MQRSSDKVGTLAAALAKAQAEIANPEKSLTATIESPFPREGQRTLSLCSLVDRASTSSANAWASMRSRPSRHRHRPGQRPDQTDDHPGPRLRRMGVLGLAGLPGQRDGSSPPDGRRAHLCPALCPVHPGRDRRRGRSRCARPYAGAGTASPLRRPADALESFGSVSVPRTSKIDWRVLGKVGGKREKSGKDHPACG